MDKREIFLWLIFILSVGGTGIEIQRIGTTETKTYNGAHLITQLLMAGLAAWVLFF